MEEEFEESEEIAVIGISCRFPLSNTPNEFWAHLLSSKELIQKVEPDNPLKSYIGSKGYLENLDYFDADLFEINPREAKFIDPQQRILLECAWECFEDASINPDFDTAKTGIFVGANTSHYFLHHLLPLIKKRKVIGQDEMLILVNNANDYLASRISYLFNLTGPSISLQSACSTSLLAICQGCQALLSYQCDQALAGGVSVTLPSKEGYNYTPDSIYSSDGHCRPFDHLASGTVFGDGGALVLLKRYSEAIKDRDNIYAIIKASVTNNDGRSKANFFMPSREGQYKAISEAIAYADIPANSIGYIETHGTGTQIGDPIEINALKDVFSDLTEKKQFCAIGSVKSNLGHLNSAAGIAGFIKTLFCLKEKTIPPTLHFEKENPYLNLKDSPFYVVSQKPKLWHSKGARIAGVSSFGIGGTNVHLILKEYNLSQNNNDSNFKLNIFPFSAQNRVALRELINRFEKMLQNDSLNFEEIAYSLQVGRRKLSNRKSFIASSLEELKSKLAYPEQNINSFSVVQSKKCIWSFPYISEHIDLMATSKCFNPVLKKNLEQLYKYDLRDIDNQQGKASLIQFILALSLIEIGIFPDKVINENPFNPIDEIIKSKLSLDSGISLLIEKSHLHNFQNKKNFTKQNQNLSFEDKATLKIDFDLQLFQKVSSIDNTFIDMLSVLWDNGSNIRFDLLYDFDHPKRISLPTYPFQRKKFWVEVEENESLATKHTEEPQVIENDDVFSEITHLFKISLELTEVDVMTDFFSLGGDSLLALEIADQIRNKFQVEVEMKTLFMNFSVQGVYEYVRSKMTLPIN